jgi:excisionase family DNA binding protein
VISSIEPGEVDSQTAERAARRIRDYLERHPDASEDATVHIEGVSEEDVLVVPRAVVVLVAQISLQLASGVGVSIVPSHAELTTQEAADLLNVSRPYLIGLLEEDKITYRTVGRHRRIRFEDLMRYKRQNDVDTRAAADELTALSQELGLY